MKKEMIKFVSENFEVIKNQFMKNELEILAECFNDELNDIEEFIYLMKFLVDQMNVLTAEELIDVINDRSIGIDLDDEDEVNELFDMIKALKE
jgi:hypothetical protein